MVVDVRVPSVGESVHEVYVGRWHKQAGDRVAAGEPLVEIESEKATMDVPAPADGVLAEVLKGDGDEARVGEVIARLRPVGEAGAGGAAPAAGEPDPEPVPRREAVPHHPPAAPPGAPASGKESGREPVRPYVAQPDPSPDPGSAGAPPSAQAAAQAAGADRSERRVRITPVRRRIAERLVEARRTQALVTTYNEVDMSRVMALRHAHKDAFQEKYGVKLGIVSFFVKAVIDALRLVPELNAELRRNHIVYRDYCDIGIAVGGGRALVVPVLRNAERMSWPDIERAIDDFARRAREGTLGVDELTGGTFTISNGGVYGSLFSTPLVNPPQSGVLGLHRIQKRPVAVGDRMVVRPMMYVALTYDHRIVDGREAVTFLRRVKETVEEPTRLLLEV